MQTEPDLSTVAALIGDPARATILSALLGGVALPASELAYRAHITAQTASAHLGKLVEGGLLGVERSGRHRYYRLKNAEVARVLETLAAISPAPHLKTRVQSEEYDTLCFARTCYDHLAGKLGVALTQALLARDLIREGEQAYALTEAGSNWLAGWEIDEAVLRKGRRLFAPTCLDWSERQHHLAGALGAAIALHLFDRGWITRIPGGRAVQLTDDGKRGLRHEFAVELDVTRAAAVNSA